MTTERGTITLRLGPVEAAAIRRAVSALIIDHEGEEIDRETRRDIVAAARVDDRIVEAMVAKGWRR